MPPIASPVRTIALLSAGLVLLTACGGGAGDSTAKPGRAEGYPVTLKNCGRTVTVDAAPRRAVSVDQGSTEILLSLGLDKPDGRHRDLDRPGDEGPGEGQRRGAQDRGRPAVLGEGPRPRTGLRQRLVRIDTRQRRRRPREQFESLGVPTYVSPADCTGKENSGGGDGARTAPLTMDTVYGEVRDLARVFGVPERGDALVAQLRERVKKATEGIDASGTTLLYWFSDSKAPYLAGCCGAPGIITEELGAKNVFDDTHEEWPQISWETVADRNPDVLVIGDLTRKAQTAESAAKKIEFLESNPATKNMDAVRHKRYVLLSGQAMNPSIRTVEGVERVAAGLRRFGLAG